MSSYFIVPTFSNSTPNKVHNQLTVTGQNTVSHPSEKGCMSAIATESIPATADGEYIFAVHIDNIGENECIMIGITPMETFDSNKESHPGWNEMTGSALHLNNRNYMPGNGPVLVDATITTKAKEIVVVVTIANNGVKKLIRWIVDGTSSVNHDCTAQCNGNTLFPVVSLYPGQQVTTIFPSIKSQSAPAKFAALLKKYDDTILPPLPPQTPVLMKEALVDNFPDQLALKLNKNVVHSVLFGLASAGKSTVFNFINYALFGEKFPGGRATGESMAAGGQFSTQCFREPASVHLGWDVNLKGDLLLTDTVGFKGDESELFAIGNGKLKQVEAWPRDNSEASLLKRVEILNRTPQTTRPTCFVLLISADQLMNTPSKADDNIVKCVIEAAKTKFKSGEYQVEIPLIVVITKVDRLDDVKKEDLLLQRKSPKLADIFKKCHDRFGIALDDIVALGLMDETDPVDFSPNTKDPRVLAVRHLLLRIAEGAQICAKRFKNLELGASAPSAANHDRTEHVADPADEYDGESVASTHPAQIEGEPLSRSNDYFEELMNVRGHLLSVQTQIVEQRMQFKSFLEAYVAQPPKKSVKKIRAFRTKVR